MNRSSFRYSKAKTYNQYKTESQSTAKEVKIMNEDSICLDLFPEKSCNRGCKHCGFDSSMNDPRQSLSVCDVHQLVDEIKKMNNTFLINITGGGEPMLNNSLPQIVELLLDADNIAHIDLTTSGQLANDQREMRHLDEILAMDRSKKLSVRLSFNEYNPTGTERFTNSLMRLIKSPCVKRIKVAIRFSLERIISTHEKFLDCLFKATEMLCDEIEIYEGLLHPDYDYHRRVVDSDFFSRYGWNEYIHAFAIAQTFLMEIPYYLTSLRYSPKEIIVEPMFLHLVGRARYLKESPMMTMRLMQKKQPEKETPRLVVGYDGYFYPSYMCFYRDCFGAEPICDTNGCQPLHTAATHSELMRLGRVGTRSLEDVIKMKALLRKHAPENFISVPNLIRHECQICLEQKLLLFGRC
jgi:organic radical activating enzyme